MSDLKLLAALLAKDYLSYLFIGSLLIGGESDGFVYPVTPFLQEPLLNPLHLISPY